MWINHYIIFQNIHFNWINKIVLFDTLFIFFFYLLQLLQKLQLMGVSILYRSLHSWICWKLKNRCVSQQKSKIFQIDKLKVTFEFKSCGSWHTLNSSDWGLRLSWYVTIHIPQASMSTWELIWYTIIILKGNSMVSKNNHFRLNLYYLES